MGGDADADADAQALALPPPEAEFHLSSLVYDMSHQIQMAMANMLKMTKKFRVVARNRKLTANKKTLHKSEKEKENKFIPTIFLTVFVALSSVCALIYEMHSEVDQDSMGITEEISRCKDSALERKKALEDEKEKFQKAAYTVLNMLNN